VQTSLPATPRHRSGPGRHAECCVVRIATRRTICRRVNPRTASRRPQACLLTETGAPGPGRPGEALVLSVHSPLPYRVRRRYLLGDRPRTRHFETSPRLLLNETDAPGPPGGGLPARPGTLMNGRRGVVRRPPRVASAVQHFTSRLFTEQAIWPLSTRRARWTPTSIAAGGFSTAISFFVFPRCLAPRGRNSRVGTYAATTVSSRSAGHETGGSWVPAPKASMPAGATPRADPNGVF